MKRYNSIAQVMKTKRGKALYKLISESFDRHWKMSPTAAKLVGAVPCVVGSQTHIELLVLEIMQTEEQV